MEALTWNSELNVTVLRVKVRRGGKSKTEDALGEILILLASGSSWWTATTTDTNANAEMEKMSLNGSRAGAWQKLVGYLACSGARPSLAIIKTLVFKSNALR